MERTSTGSSNFIKHQSSNSGGRNMKEINQDSCNKVKSLWDLTSECNGTEADLLGLFSWPPRSYSCTFCKREFRSAQALGGHMNVHRRDRARLRQSPPPQRDHHHGPYSLLNLNLDPNPNFSLNPNPSLSSSVKSPTVLSLPSSIPPSVSTISTTPPATVTGMRKWEKAGFVGLSHSKPRSSTQDLMKSKATKRLFELEKLGSIMHEKEATAAQDKSDIVRLELEIGLLSEVKEDLDLELRLGYI